MSTTPAAPAGTATTRTCRDAAWTRRTRLVVAAVLGVLWLLWAVTTWHAQVRPVTADQLRSDVAAGDVTGYTLTRSVDVTDHGWPEPDTTDLPTAGDGRHGGIVLYRTASGSLRYVVGIRQVDPGDIRGGYGDVGATDLSRDLVATLDGAGVAHRSAFYPPNLPGAAAGLLTLAALALLLGAPRPTRGTRWFWFWLVYLTPGAVGLLGYAAAELVAPAPAGAKRLPGLAGAALGFVASLAFTLAAAGLRSWLGTAAIPG